MLVEDVTNRVSGPVQIATDNLPFHQFYVRQHFGYEGYFYKTETKFSANPDYLRQASPHGRNEGCGRRLPLSGCASLIHGLVCARGF